MRIKHFLVGVASMMFFAALVMVMPVTSHAATIHAAAPPPVTSCASHAVLVPNTPALAASPGVQSTSSTSTIAYIGASTARILPERVHASGDPPNILRTAIYAYTTTNTPPATPPPIAAAIMKNATTMTATATTARYATLNMTRRARDGTSTRTATMPNLISRAT